MTDTRHPMRMDAQQRRSVQEISRLFDVAGRESEVIAGLAGGMDQLRAVRVAKHALATLTPADVGVALACRRTRRAGPTGQSGAGRPAGTLS